MSRGLASGLLAVFTATLALANLNVAPAERIMATAGLDQEWGMFAPEPRQHELVLEAEVRYADGGRAMWRPPRRRALPAAVGYRMEMWASRVVRDDNSELWRPAAMWIARRYGAAGRRPVSVTLRRRWRPVARPAQPAPSRIWNEFDIYTLDTR